MKTIFKKEQIVLFQGDSVTACGRNKDDMTSLGEGYARMVAEWFSMLFPDYGIKFINKGVSGNRVRDLLERYEEDIWNINPDFISILIGINDTWRRFDSNNPTSTLMYESYYRKLLEKIRLDLPHCRIMIIEPFVLHSLPDRIQWRVDLNPKIQVARKLAKEYADFYLPLDAIYAKAEVEECNSREMAVDGIHPTIIGHRIIAREYLKIIAQ